MLPRFPRAIHGLFTSERQGRAELLDLEDVLTLYSIALFFHIAGALGVFAALALDWVGITSCGAYVPSSRFANGQACTESSARSEARPWPPC